MARSADAANTTGQTDPLALVKRAAVPVLFLGLAFALARGKFVETMVNGLTQGAMIALVALGYTMVYGVLKLINFAHSEVFMMAAYIGLFLIMAFGGSSNPMLATVAGTLLSMVGAALIGITVERVAYRPLRGRGKGALVRITPLFLAPFVTYALALTSMRYRDFAIGSALGVIPGITVIASGASTLLAWWLAE